MNPRNVRSFLIDSRVRFASKQRKIERLTRRVQRDQCNVHHQHRLLIVTFTNDLRVYTGLLEFKEPVC